MFAICGGVQTLNIYWRYTAYYYVFNQLSDSVNFWSNEFFAIEGYWT